MEWIESTYIDAFPKKKSEKRPFFAYNYAVHP